MKILVCGGRHYRGWWRLVETLDALNFNEITLVVHGCAVGADTLADRWAVMRRVQRCRHPADWEKHGRAAGIIRNREMLEHHPNLDLVVAFPGGRGTSHMATMAENRNIRVFYADLQ